MISIIDEEKNISKLYREKPNNLASFTLKIEGYYANDP